MMDINQFIEKVENEIDSQNIVDLTQNLCSQKTVNPPGNEFLCEKILEDFMRDEIGVDDVRKYEKVEKRTNLVGYLPGNEEGLDLAIVGHLDVVPVEGQDWSTDPFDPIVTDGRIYARGAADNKGPFAAVLEGIRIFSKIVGEDFSGRIQIIAAADEEHGSDLGIKYLFDKEQTGLTCDAALIPDGGEFSDLIYGEMGILTLEFKSTGEAYHGSMPEKGKNAIIPLAELAMKLNEYDWSQLSGSDEFDHTVVNIGMIKGGNAPNIVPDKASLIAMWRYPSGIEHAELIRIVDKMIEKTGGEIEYNIKHSSSPFLSDKNNKLIEACKKSSQILQLGEQNIKTIRAETVAKYIHQLCGASVLVNGPEDGSTSQMHQPNESIKIDSLVNFAKYYAVILYLLLVEK